VHYLGLLINLSGRKLYCPEFHERENIEYCIHHLTFNKDLHFIVATEEFEAN